MLGDAIGADPAAAFVYVLFSLFIVFDADNAAPAVRLCHQRQDGVLATKLAGALGQLGGEGVVDAVLDGEAVGADAGLAAVAVYLAAMAPSTAASTETASSKTMNGALPPSSSERRSRWARIGPSGCARLRWSP